MVDLALHEKFNQADQAFCTRAFWLAIGFALLMVLVYPTLSWDIQLSDYFFKAHQGGFIYKHQPFLSDWMHTKLKWLMVMVGLASLLLALVAPIFTLFKPHQKSLLWSFVGMVCATSAVAISKHFSVHGCPWDLSIYGGDLPLLGLFAKLPAGVEAGQCFPAGHPSAGFALMAFYFAFRHSKPRFALAMLWLGATMGMVMGGAQIMRGAHFLSHVLWSGWVVWVTLLALYYLWPPMQSAGRSESTIS